MNKSWQTKRLGDITTLVKGKKPKLFTKTNGKPYLTARVVRGTEVPDLVDNDCPLSVWVKPEDIVIIMDGSNSGEMFSGLDGALASTMGVIKFDKELLEPRYLYSFLVTHRENFTKSRTGAAIPHLNKEGFENLEIPTPPLSEQKKIVKMVDEAFEKIAKAKENAEKNLQNSKELFESYLHSIFQNTDDDWSSVELGEIASFRNGLNFTKTSRGEKIKIVGVKDFQNHFLIPFENLEYVTIDGELNAFDQLKKGDILTVRSNGNPELIGRTLLAEDIVGKTSYSGFTIRIRPNQNVIYSAYLCHYLKSKVARRSLVESGAGVNIKSLNQVALSKLMIPSPQSLTKQKELVEKINSLSEQTKKLEANYKQKIADLDELKKSLLNKAFAGEL